MMRQTFTFLCLLMLLIAQGCAMSPYRPPTPYRKQPTIEQQRDVRGTTEPVRAPTSALINDIRQQAGQLTAQGELDAAAQTLERGLRIAPKDASLWSQLATVRLQQHRYEQALSLAAKSNNLAGDNPALVRRNQHIIEKAQSARY